MFVSDIPENKETVDSSGYYFKSNDLNSLSEAIDWLDRNPQDVQKKSAESIERVRTHYSWDVVADQLFALSDNASGTS